MQIAHPKVAAGVAQHSHFKDDPMSRLRRTMDAMWSITFDETAAARASLERITAVHSKVRGVVAPGEISFSASPYDASDPELLLWVHATLIDSGMLAYHCFAKPLSSNDAEQYYDDSKVFARLFQIPESIIPPTLAEFQQYMNAMITGDRIAVGATARSLARDILYPSPWFMKPGGPMFRLVTAGLLP
ncbi:MAG TPA: oxygenase MpaB family protein, partial [Candidatus Binatia bacterium]|nr:oxygenase MpaB family protein [Candidatus Binatia bacterium]